MDAARFCPHCGGELEKRRQKLGQVILTHLHCYFCYRLTPQVECDPVTHVHRELILEPDPGAVNTWLPTTLRGKRLQASVPDPNRVYKTVCYERGWTRVDIGPREAWLSPGQWLLLEVLGEMEQGNE